MLIAAAEMLRAGAGPARIWQYGVHREISGTVKAATGRESSIAGTFKIPLGRRDSRQGAHVWIRLLFARFASRQLSRRPRLESPGFSDANYANLERIQPGGVTALSSGLVL